jgi:hypothetical protein
MNSFLLLQEQEQQVFVKKYEDEIRRNVESRLKTVHFISDVFEHFFPKLSDTLTVLAGGGTIDPEDVYLTIDEADVPPRKSSAPGTPEGDDIIR